MLSTAEEIREVRALIVAWKAHTSHVRQVLDNPDRTQKELEREEKKLADQQAKVDRLKRYRDDGYPIMAEYSAKIEAGEKKLLELLNKRAIERLLELSHELDELNSKIGKRPETVIAAMDPEDE